MTQEKRKFSIWKVFLWLLFLPVMATIAVWKGKWEKKWKALATAAIWVLFILLYGQGNTTETDNSIEITTTRNIVDTDDTGKGQDQGSTDGTQIILASESIDATEGTDFTIAYSVVNKRSKKNEVSFSIADESIATYKGGSTFTAVKAGSTAIVISCGDSSAVCYLHVSKSIIPIQTVELKELNYDLPVGISIEIEYTYQPKDATYTDVLLTAPGECLEIDGHKITARAEGDTAVSLEQGGRVLATVYVHTYSIPVESVEFCDVAEEAFIGRPIDIAVKYSPAEADWSSIQFVSSNPEVLQIDDTSEFGHVTAVGVAPGKATVSAVISDEKGVAVTNQITVLAIAPTELRITADNASPTVGSEGSFGIAFTPEDATNSDIAWKSSNTKIIKVNNDGSYTAAGVGTATITATHKNGVSATISIEVLPLEVEKIIISSSWKEGENFVKGKKQTLTAVFTPSNATDQSLTWSSSDESIATVNSKGVVTAIAPGTATITATAKNGVSADYSVTVAVTPQRFKINISARMTSNDHVGSRWSKEYYLNDDEIKNGGYVTILPGEEFSVEAIILENDKNPDSGVEIQKYTLTNEMCQKGFTFEAEIVVRENSGRYAGNYAYWTVKITFTPVG